MRMLSAEEVRSLVAKGRSLPETKIKAILDDLERSQPSIYRFIYGEPSDSIAVISKDMSNLYLDLAFDVVWIFREAFGRPPGRANAEAWILKEPVMSPVEQKAMALEMEVDERKGVRLQGHPGKASVHRETQFALLKYLENEANEYVLFQGKRAPALQLTRNLLFVLVGLISDLYSEAKAKSA